MPLSFITQGAVAQTTQDCEETCEKQVLPVVCPDVACHQPDPTRKSTLPFRSGLRYDHL